MVVRRRMGAYLKAHPQVLAPAPVIASDAKKQQEPAVDTAGVLTSVPDSTN